MVLASTDRPPLEGDVMTWADAARLPLALLTPDMRIHHQVIDNAFDESGVTVETDSPSPTARHPPCRRAVLHDVQQQ